MKQTYIDYSSTITDLAAGSYRVRIFEGQGDRDPKFIGSANVTVAGL